MSGRAPSPFSGGLEHAFLYPETLTNEEKRTWRQKVETGGVGTGYGFHISGNFFCADALAGGEELIALPCSDNDDYGSAFTSLITSTN